MIRLLALIAVLALGLAAQAAPLTRWTSQPLEGATKVVSGGPGASTLVVLRTGMDPLRSVDGGRTWTSFNVNGARPADVSIAPTDGRTWYAITVADAAELTPKVVFQTRDGGNTWEERSRVSTRYAIAPQVGPDPNHLYLASFDIPSGSPAPGSFARVLASADGGRTWTEPNPETRLFRFVRSTVDSRRAFGTMPAGTLGVVVRTVDGGATWTQVSLPRTNVFQTLGLIALDRVDPNVVYVRSEQNRSTAAQDIYITRDGGQTWTTVVQPEGKLVADPTAGGRVYLLAFDGRFLESRDFGRTWVTVDNGDERISRASQVDDDPGFAVTAAAGRREVVSVGAAKLDMIDITHGAVALGSDLWWNPAESGAGLTITQHVSNNPFIVWYTYNATGAPVWRVVPGGTWNDRAFTGDMYETTGPAYFAGAFDPARVASRKVGTATLRFDDENNAAFVYAMPGIAAGEKRIARQQFAPPTSPSAESIADLYWNPAESGWGIAINHQSSRIFATWFAYGDDGKPLWIVMPDAVVFEQFAGIILFPAASGDIYTTRGPAEGIPFDPSKVVATKVGTAKLSWFSQNSAYLEYTAFGRTETRVVRRQPF